MAIRVGMYTKVYIEITISFMDIIRKDYDRMIIDGDIPCRTRDGELAWENANAYYSNRFRIKKAIYVRR